MLIYKITNIINNKCYIGQTIKQPEKRWKEHQQHAFGLHQNDKNKVLYQAIRKYGLENFTFEVLQDNIQSYDELDKAEIYWINFYNSYLKGYNATSGGQTYHSRFPNKDIIDDYMQTKSARATALKFGIDHNTVDRILNENNIPRFTHRQTMGKKLRISKGNFIKEFDSVKDCAEWFVNSNIPRTKSSESVRTSLRDIRRKYGNTGTYYGYLIEEL